MRYQQMADNTSGGSGYSSPIQVSPRKQQLQQQRRQREQNPDQGEYTLGPGTYGEGDIMPRQALAATANAAGEVNPAFNVAMGEGGRYVFK